MFKITSADASFEIKKLIAPFGFKGKYVENIWFANVTLGSGDIGAFSRSVQSPLWSDSALFKSVPVAASNAMMFAITCRGLKLIEGESFSRPEEVEEFLLPKLLGYARDISGLSDIRTTFVLNALVAIDYAAWELYAKLNSLSGFDSIIPDYAKSALSYRAEKMLRIPLVTYGLNSEDILSLISDGNYFLKIKIGNDPDKDGDQRKMLEWDKARLSQIHSLARDIENPYSESRTVPYYLDANGRYETKELFSEFLEHADKIGALSRIIFIEEPFDERKEYFVGDLPVRIAADESAHSLEDVKRLAQRGYGAVALKPIAKTQSESFKIAAFCHEHSIPAFCADLTVPPDMLENNKKFAARLKALPGMLAAAVESNGHQNYPDWDNMLSTLPPEGAEYRVIKNGVYSLDSGFFKL
ncbi:MAG: hypothetical protein VB118_06275 [Oscillospiraceae bacterium]|nr:hypothetical protein [Oscillospiraceae bacterium]